MTNSTVGEEVRSLVNNLASRWNDGDAVLKHLMEAAGGEEIGPYAAFRRIGEEGLEGLFGQGDGREMLRDAFDKLTRYLNSETWFDRTSREDTRLVGLRGHPVAYFCAEFALDDWLPMYSGGLGVLAGDVLKESSDMGLPLVAVGLFYRHGFFYQRMDENGHQTEEYPTLDPQELPLAPACSSDGTQIVVPVPMGDRTVYAQVWQLQVGRITVYLLDTDTEHNQRVDDRAITGNLYGGNHETRIQQELVLGVGGVRALRALGIAPSVFSMNEGHAAFLGLELVAEMLGEMDFDTALRRVRSHVVYTNHTVVPAGNDIFSRDLARQYLGHYVDEHAIGIERLLGLASNGPDDGFSMAILAFRLSGKANAVSQIHGEVIPREWPGVTVEAVTNGVHIPTWLGPEMRKLLDRYLGDWRGDAPDWEKVHTIPADELWDARSKQRHNLISFISRTVPGKQLNPDALTLVWARRFAEYKRAWMLASDLGRLSALLSNPERPVQIVISGKSHPRDEDGKRVMQDLLHRLEAAVGSHVAFVPDYRMRIATRLTGGADVWVNTPRKPLEASGTSGMKASDNGSLQLTVRDGWAAEVDWWNVGWGIEGRDDESDARDLYGYLENSIVPCFYSRDESGVPQEWIAMMKKTMILTLSRYSTRRMVLEYIHRLYVPLIQEQGVVDSVAV